MSTPLPESIQLEHLPPSYTLHAALYTDITNAAFLHQQLLAGNSEFEYALIDASIIVSRVQALAAAFRAANDLIERRLRTRNVHSEMVFALSPNNNIASSFRTFGISPSTTSLLIIKLSTPAHHFTPSSIATHLASNIHGTPLPFSDSSLSKLTDWKKVSKAYKMPLEIRDKSGKPVAIERKELEVQVLGGMALRGFS